MWVVYGFYKQLLRRHYVVEEYIKEIFNPSFSSLGKEGDANKG